MCKCCIFLALRNLFEIEIGPWKTPGISSKPSIVDLQWFSCVSGVRYISLWLYVSGMQVYHDPCDILWYIVISCFGLLTCFLICLVCLTREIHQSRLVTVSLDFVEKQTQSKHGQRSPCCFSPPHHWPPSNEPAEDVFNSPQRMPARLTDSSSMWGSCRRPRYSHLQVRSFNQNPDQNSTETRGDSWGLVQPMNLGWPPKPTVVLSQWASMVTSLLMASRSMTCSPCRSAGPQHRKNRDLR